MRRFGSAAIPTDSGRSSAGVFANASGGGFDCDVYDPPNGFAVDVQQEQPIVNACIKSLAGRWESWPAMTCAADRSFNPAAFRLDVPDDVAVVGVDEDRLLCELSNPPLPASCSTPNGRIPRGGIAARADVGPRRAAAAKFLVAPLWSYRDVPPT